MNGSSSSLASDCLLITFCLLASNAPPALYKPEEEKGFFNQSKTKQVILSKILHCLRQTLHGRSGGKKEGTSRLFSCVLETLCTRTSICSRSREAQCATLFCLMVLELDHTEVVETTHYSMEKQSLVTLDLGKARKTIKPLPWSLTALTVLSSSCQHTVTLTSWFSAISLTS